MSVLFGVLVVCGLLGLAGSVLVVSFDRQNSRPRLRLAKGSLTVCAEPRGAFNVELDGDRRSDRLTMLSCHPAGRPSEWEQVLRIAFSSGGVSEHVADFGGAHWPIGTTDLNRDGRRELWLELGGNSAWSVGAITITDSKDVVDVGSFTYYVKYSGVVGVECNDVDRDGRDEIVETFLGGVDLRPKAYLTELDGSWSYHAYKLRGGVAQRVKDEGSADGSLRPRSLRWRGGFDCDVAPVKSELPQQWLREWGQSS